MDDSTQAPVAAGEATSVLHELLLERGLSMDPQPIALTSVRAYLRRVGASDINEGYRREGWVVQLLPISELRAMPDDFRGYPLLKGERFSSLMSRARLELSCRGIKLLWGA